MALVGWLSFILIIYTSTIYPLSVFLLARARYKPPDLKTQFQPCVSIIVPIYNAEKHIENKIRNLQSINYPSEKLEIIFVSDGSTDGSIAKIAHHKDIKFIASKNRIGKENAIKKALAHVKNEIVCLTDVGTEMNADGLKELVAHMESPDIGAASSVDGVDKDSYALEKLLLAYENQVRINESRIFSSTGLSGSFFVTRRKILNSIPDHCASDFAVALQCVSNGLKTVVDENAIGYYRKSSGLNVEFKRKTRTIVHGLNTLIQYRRLLNVFQHGMFSWQLISHKLLRWLTPFSVLGLAIIAAAFLAEGILSKDIITILIAVSPILLYKNFLVKNILLLFAYNLAMVFALYKVIAGINEDAWEPTKRDI